MRLISLDLARQTLWNYFQLLNLSKKWTIAADNAKSRGRKPLCSAGCYHRCQQWCCTRKPCREESLPTTLATGLMLEATHWGQFWEQNSQKMLWGSWIVTGLKVGSHRHPESEGSGRRHHLNLNVSFKNDAVTRPLAQLWTSHPNLATKFLKVTPILGV